tara:strand:- start:444 stop:770 length:327 start_codon:yes stop_codon:yes gene_type:complete
MYFRIFYCCRHDDFIIDSYNKSFTLEDIGLYDYDVNNYNCDIDLDCSYEYLTLARKKNNIFEILDIKSEEKWLKNGENNSNLNLYLEEVCNGGINQKIIFDTLYDKFS